VGRVERGSAFGRYATYYSRSQLNRDEEENGGKVKRDERRFSSHSDGSKEAGAQWTQQVIY